MFSLNIEMINVSKIVLLTSLIFVALDSTVLTWSPHKVKELHLESQPWVEHLLCAAPPQGSDGVGEIDSGAGRHTGSQVSVFNQLAYNLC